MKTGKAAIAGSIVDRIGADHGSTTRHGFKLGRAIKLMPWCGFTLRGPCCTVSAQQSLVEKIVLKDTIQPVSAGMLERALARANDAGAAALLIEMDTPGGLVDSMRGMAGAILGSRVPVIIYVGPTGARAGSAGFFLLEAADVAAMAPGTEAGAAHVVFMGGKPDDTEMQKVENDAEAFLRSYVKPRNRNVDAAIAAVASSHSYTAEEALSQHLIDLIASRGLHRPCPRIESGVSISIDAASLARANARSSIPALTGWMVSLRTIFSTISCWAETAQQVHAVSAIDTASLIARPNLNLPSC